jgi:predicted Zn-dependent peptidase
MVVVIAGDVDPKEARRLAGTYFSALPAGPAPPRVITAEPIQEGERRVAIESPSQPLIFFGYKRPPTDHADDAALSVLASALASGRTGVLYREMVEQKKLSLGAVASANFISQKYPGLFMFGAAPAVGKTLDENEKALLEIVERVKKQKFEDAVLSRVKNQVRAGLIRALDSNFGMAQQLAANYMLFGDWRRMFTRIQEIEKVTADDVTRVARTYLQDNQKTVVYTKAPAKEDNK